MLLNWLNLCSKVTQTYERLFSRYEAVLIYCCLAAGRETHYHFQSSFLGAGKCLEMPFFIMTVKRTEYEFATCSSLQKVFLCRLWAVDVACRGITDISSPTQQQLHSESHFCPPDESRCNINFPFSSVFGLHHLLREICVSIAAKRSTTFIS